MADPTQWINENRYRAYPFVEDSNLTDDGGTLTLPNSTLVDISVVAYGPYGINIKLDEVDVAALGATLTFKFQYGPDTAPLYASIVVPGTVTSQYTGEVTVLGPDAATQIFIRATFAEGVSEISATPVHQGNTFSFTDLIIEPSTVSINDNDRVTSVNNLTGDVKFDNGYNTVVKLIETSNTLEVKAETGAGLGFPCEPFYGDEDDCDGLVYYINGEHADWLGRFILQAGPGIIVKPDPGNNKLIITGTRNAQQPACQDFETDPDV